MNGRTSCTTNQDLAMEKKRLSKNYAEDLILGKCDENPLRSTPLIVTFYEHSLTTIDIHKILEMGLQIIRFRMMDVTREDQLKLIDMIHNAQSSLCEKYGIANWPIAKCIDLPHAAIRSGYISQRKKCKSIFLKIGTKVEITAEQEYSKECHESRVYIDDSATVKAIKLKDEITFGIGGVQLTCVKLINQKSVLCEVTKQGFLYNNEFVTVRGIKVQRSSFSQNDLETLQFAKEHQYDVLTVFCVSSARTIKSLRRMCGEKYQPLIFSTICNQEGVDKIDEIIEASDGIILARTFLSHQLVNRCSLAALQMQICAKCKKVGKPIYISGILHKTLKSESYDKIDTRDISDLTNMILQSAGLTLPDCKNVKQLVKAVNVINDVCKYVEAMHTEDDELIRLFDEYKMPVNAAEGSILACALMIKQVKAPLVIIPTVTGHTAIQLAYKSSRCIIVPVSRNQKVARKLQLYRGIYAVVYDKPKQSDWNQEMEARIQFALTCALRKDMLRFGGTYVTLRKGTPMSSFCDQVSVRVFHPHEAAQVKKTILNKNQTEPCHQITDEDPVSFQSLPPRI